MEYYSAPAFLSALSSLQETTSDKHSPGCHGVELSNQGSRSVSAMIRASDDSSDLLT